MLRADQSEKNVCSSVLTTGQLAWVNSCKGSVVRD